MTPWKIAIGLMVLPVLWGSLAYSDEIQKQIPLMKKSKAAHWGDELTLREGAPVRIESLTIELSQIVHPVTHNPGDREFYVLSLKSDEMTKSVQYDPQSNSQILGLWTLIRERFDDSSLTLRVIPAQGLDVHEGGLEGIVFPSTKEAFKSVFGPTTFQGGSYSSNQWWDPTVKQVKDAESALKKVFQKKGPILGKPISQYKRQYTGIRRAANHKEVYINLFCNSSESDWKRHEITTVGGGDCYVQATYDVDDQKIIELSVNGETGGKVFWVYASPFLRFDREVDFLWAPRDGFRDVDFHEITEAGWVNMKRPTPEAVARLLISSKVPYEAVRGAIFTLQTKGDYQTVKIVVDEK